MYRLVFALFALVAGCTAPPLVELGAAHPASPQAPEAPAPPPAHTLDLERGDPPSPATEPSHHVH
jgi:hypothetical protein